MTGPASPGAEGPTFAPPHLPPGWIAQWDGASRKYYYVQLSTGVSQWDVPTDAAPTGSTPAPVGDHPYGVPPQNELITHPDGSQTLRHADGTMEPVNPPMPPDGTSTRGGDGPVGDRGLGSMAMNMLMGGKDSRQGSSGKSPLGNIAGHIMGGGNYGGQGGGGGGGGGKNPLGKIGGALASSLLNTGGGSKPDQPGTFHGGPVSGQQQQHGLAGSIMGGVANMFGGSSSQTQGGSGFGYSNTGGTGPYTGPAPPVSYEPPGTSSSSTSGMGRGSTYESRQSNQTGAQRLSNSHASGTSGNGASFDRPPASQQTYPAYGQMPPPSSSAGRPAMPTYGQNPQSYGGPSPAGVSQQQYGAPSSYNPHYSGGGGAPVGYPGAQHSFPTGPQHRGHNYGSPY
ncbi:hypothetical protein ACRALDRAFT_2038382 [Sodiomyces alcalophilus JCM 7366]|uniref:uncharacterized protein n=1 Tax=Sodiomyces alcalophilus JCM 7366 TaxID=591952 RepID=UPI0039B461A5